MLTFRLSVPSSKESCGLQDGVVRDQKCVVESDRRSGLTCNGRRKDSSTNGEGAVEGSGSDFRLEEVFRRGSGAPVFLRQDRDRRLKESGLLTGTR